MRIIPFKRMYLPAFTIIGVVLLLLVLIGFSTYRNLNRERKISLGLLYREGLALLRSLEAGSRAGMIMITPAEFPEALRGLESEGERLDLTPGRSLKEVEKQMILRTLEQTGGNRTRAAKTLGISRPTLQFKLKEYASS